MSTTCPLQSKINELEVKMRDKIDEEIINLFANINELINSHFLNEEDPTNKKHELTTDVSNNLSVNHVDIDSNIKPITINSPQIKIEKLELSDCFINDLQDFYKNNDTVDNFDSTHENSFEDDKDPTYLPEVAVVTSSSYMAKIIASQPPNSVYECKKCEKGRTETELDETFNNELNLDGHSNSVFYCDECDFVTHFRSSICRHKKVVHDKRKAQDKSISLHQCDKCEFVTHYKSGLKRHMKTIHEGSKVQCEVCKEKFTQNSSLKLHKKRTGHFSLQEFGSVEVLNIAKFKKCRCQKVKCIHVNSQVRQEIEEARYSAKTVIEKYANTHV